ncbi:hypothetical protein PLESTB_000755200 [Pleodorina starrii]|uniref:Coenzyme Q-binding protein COQ10 START domain-containing protein n=1 Tax=Pleodorina starrii TaxID=330485 RepID=A0A9W6F260_9CHLO|nr:hypothetical protein PLESTM_001571000 [Pleodorina starrii]GLC53489.1 hypothetical protein PLESTB_000755200 [Pleodorina starrii]GLC69774.1 hypothetical protein PLESTF_000879300 [Pleodorina starrii]
MVFGRGRGTALSEQQQPNAAAADDAMRTRPRSAPGPPGLLSPGPASLTAAAANDVSCAPLPAAAGSDAGRKPKHLPPFDVKRHDVKARLQDRSTAVVDLVSVVDAPGDVMFDLLADPHQHERIFGAIESANAELVSEEGAVRKWRLDYRARWSFWKVGGVCDNRLWMTTDREAGTVSFALREPGFLRTYEGTWTITGPDGRGPGAAPRRDPAATAASASQSAPISAFHGLGGGGVGGLAGLFAAINNPFFAAAPPLLALIRTPDKATHPLPLSMVVETAATPSPASLAVPSRYPTTIQIRKAISPKISPPYPINQVLKGHASGQVSDMLEGLLAATAKKIALEEGEGDEAGKGHKRVGGK